MVTKWNLPNIEGGFFHWHNGEQVASYDGTTKRWLHVDHLGSPAAATDASGAVLTERREYPYGDARVVTGAAGTERLFTGQVEDSDSSLYYFNARYLETGIGRFISPDSIVPNPSDPRDHNRYAYVRNNPLTYTDPTGNCIGSISCPFREAKELAEKLGITITEAFSLISNGAKSAANGASAAASSAASATASVPGKVKVLPSPREALLRRFTRQQSRQHSTLSA